jgi:hypothetical protein
MARCMTTPFSRGVAGFLWLGGPDTRGAAGAGNSGAEGTPRYPTNFLIEFVQISGVHLIVPGGGVRTPGQLRPCSFRAGFPMQKLFTAQPLIGTARNTRYAADGQPRAMHYI